MKNYIRTAYLLCTCAVFSTSAMAANWVTIETFDFGEPNASAVDVTGPNPVITFENQAAVFRLGETVDNALVLDITEIVGIQGLRIFIKSRDCDDATEMGFGFEGVADEAFQFDSRSFSIEAVREASDPGDAAIVWLRHDRGGLQTPRLAPQMSTPAKFTDGKTLKMALRMDENRASASGNSFNTLRVVAKKKQPKTTKRYYEMSGFAIDPTGNCVVEVDKIDVLR